MSRFGTPVNDELFKSVFASSSYGEVVSINFSLLAESVKRRDHVPKLTDQTWIDWPPPEEMELIGPLSTHRGSFVKLFSQKLTAGQAAIWHGETGETLRFEFDTRTLCTGASIPCWDTIRNLIDTSRASY